MPKNSRIIDFLDVNAYSITLGTPVEFLPWLASRELLRILKIILCM